MDVTMAKNPKTSNESVSTSARTSEENDAIRRQKKAAQRKGSGKGGQQTTLKGTFFGDLMDEKATKREERARMLALKRERQMEYVGPRELAIKATDAPGLIGLDGLVLAMVVATIDKFVDVQPVTGMGRLRTAFEEVKSGLSVEDGRRHKAHGLAYRKVRDAIDWARGEIIEARKAEMTR